MFHQKEDEPASDSLQIFERLNFQHILFESVARFNHRYSNTIIVGPNRPALAAGRPSTMAEQTHWTERNGTRQAFINMPGLYRGKKKFDLFPYGPKPSEFDRYGQYLWFYGGWFIIRLSIIVAILLIILDLRLYLHPQTLEKPDIRCLPMTIVPVSRATRAANYPCMTSRLRN